MELLQSCVFLLPSPFWTTCPSLEGKQPALCTGRKQGLKFVCRNASARDIVITLGKHKGEILGALPDDYLRWMSTKLQGEWASSWAELAEEVLTERASLETNRAIANPKKRLLEQKVDYPRKVIKQTQTFPDTVATLNEEFGGQDHMMDEQADRATLASLLRRCSKDKDLSGGRLVHARISLCGFDSNTFLGNCLIEMYGNCGRVSDAQSAFDKILVPNLYSWNLLMKAYAQNRRLKDVKAVFARMPQRDVVSWSTMIAACAQHDHGDDALALFQQMQHEGVKPNKVTFVCVLEASASLAALREGQEIHANIIDSGYDQDIFVSNALINMYGKCGNVDVARMVFDRMTERDPISWNVMIATYARNKDGKESLCLFQDMQLKGIKPNKITFVSALDACASLGVLGEGKKIHSAVIDSGCAQDVVVGTALVTMYGKCGSLNNARLVFKDMPERNVISWNAMISSCAQKGQGEEALRLFHEMQHEGIKPDKITFVSALHACANLAALKQGQEIHAAILRRGYQRDVAVGTALVNMYGKCGSLHEAKSVFHKLRERNVVSWSAITVACAKNGHAMEALDLFCQRQLDGIKPDQITFIGLLDACISIAALEEGREIHALIIDCGFEQDTVMGTALIDTYGKCGSLYDARRVFDRMFQHDVVSWSAMISACARNGHGNEALKIFHQMQPNGISPNEVTLVSVLTACTHVGKFEEGRHCFVSLRRDYGMAHTVGHYVCMIDLLGRSGYLDEAEDLINHMPFKRVASAWLSLLDACRIYSDVERGISAAKHYLKLDSNNSVSYVMLAHFYAATGRWDEAMKVKETFKQRSAEQQRERSCIQVDRLVHEFAVGISHPQDEEILMVLRRLSKQLQQAGYVLEAQRLMPEESENSNEPKLCYHSVRLAVAFGFMCTAPGTPLLITKNFKMCYDCHTVTKLISNIVERRISVRDNNLFHHFEHGMCSCRDYW